VTTPIGPSFIALQVRDLVASTQFYRDVFGFEAEAQSPPGAVVFRTRPMALALRTLPATGPLGVGVALWIACTDADALHDAIVARGGTIASPPGDGPFGRFFVATDPDGYALTFHTAPA
jgi:predicted enzyme related to lactoylglutathione lyase